MGHLTVIIISAVGGGGGRGNAKFLMSFSIFILEIFLQNKPLQVFFHSIFMYTSQAQVRLAHSCMILPPFLEKNFVFVIFSPPFKKPESLS